MCEKQLKGFCEVPKQTVVLNVNSDSSISAQPLCSVFEGVFLFLKVCSFGSRVLGQGIYTFDRRLHHLRSAFSSMLEQHISAHLWK